MTETTVQQQPQVEKMSVPTLESKALRVYEINRQQALLEEEKTLLKRSIVKGMSDNKMDEHLVRLDDNADLKIVVGERTVTKLDKEEFAADLGISLDAVNKRDVLIKKTEEGKLTADTYKQYLFEETNTQLAIRKVNA